MHITLSGPYETLYTTAVDMWSFGCLCLNICIGKTAALKQREVATVYIEIFKWLNFWLSAILKTVFQKWSKGVAVSCHCCSIISKFYFRKHHKVFEFFINFVT